MHDGLLSTITVQLLEKYPHKETVTGIMNMLISGGIND